MIVCIVGSVEHYCGSVQGCLETTGYIVYIMDAMLKTVQRGLLMIDSSGVTAVSECPRLKLFRLHYPADDDTHVACVAATCLQH